MGSLFRIEGQIQLKAVQYHLIFEYSLLPYQPREGYFDD